MWQSLSRGAVSWLSFLSGSQQGSDVTNDASAEEPRIIHSLAGRLRVHLPDPSGYVVTQLRQVPGIQSAEANELTGNMLILFNPEQTSSQALLAELQELSARAPAVAPLLQASSESRALVVDELAPQGDAQLTEMAGYVTGAWRRVYQFLGWSSVGMAVVGAILPGIPTVPFVALAGYFFVRSSPQAHAWLLGSRWFGPMLRDWEAYRGVRRSVKNTALGLIAVGATITLLIGLPTVLVTAILILEAIGLLVVLRLPVIEEDAASPAGAAL